MFNKFAERVSTLISSAYFFCFCALVVVIWLPSRPLFHSNDEWQLPINTFTTIFTFLMVALLENSNRRSTQAIQLKLDTVLKGLAELSETTSETLETAIETEKNV